MPTDFRQTLVIPAHNEEALLPRLLDTVEVARARYSFGAGAIEVIVADNASTDRTAGIAAAPSRRDLRRAIRGRIVRHDHFDCARAERIARPRDFNGIKQPG